MNIVICDDEKIQRTLLHTITAAYFKQQSIPYQIQEYESCEQLLFHHENRKDIDILLLDIQMREMNGVELAKQLRAQGWQTAIIFVTGNVEFVYESFHLHAINYLLKPIEEDKVCACLSTAIDHMQIQQYMMLTSEGSIMRIAYDDVIRIQSEGHYVNVLTKQENLRLLSSLKEIEAKLINQQFYKVGRSDIVNLKLVKRITSKELMMSDGYVIPIPKGKYRELNMAFIDYHFHGGKGS